MHFPRFWAKASIDGFSCWWWSDSSEADAKFQAQKKAAVVAQRVKSGAARGDHYGYPDRALREEIVQDLKECKAVISRNSYGSLVLNTADVMFVDVDFEPAGEGPGWFARLFGAKSPAPISAIDQVLSDAERWLKPNSTWGFRIYLTKAGARLIATHALIEPNSSVAQQAFEALKCDPLYRRLCQTQKSFRARLTPKPWRCNSVAAPVRWPFENQEAQQRFAEWQESYQVEMANYATCKFIKEIGSSSEVMQIAKLVELHDKLTKASSDLPLA